MFRKLAQISESEGFTADNTQSAFVRDQALFYGSVLPNIIPTQGTSPAPKGLDKAVEVINPSLDKVINPTPDIEKYFLPMNISTEYSDKQKVCETGTIDGLIGSQNPSAPVRCGWMYTPPPAGSPFPTLSKGALGTKGGPIFPEKQYSKWFWDLEEAKKQILIDKCKALRNCADVGKDPYVDHCGYCKDIGQGVPIDSAGNPLYTGNPLTTCSPSSIVRSPNSCPPPSAIAITGAGPSAQAGQTCVPVGGRLPFGCLESIIESGGCSTDGALAIALGSGAKPDDYMAGVRQLKSMQLYNERSRTPFPVDVFAQGRIDTATALTEVRKLAANAKTEPERSAIGAAARDLCVRKGELDKFDFCTDINVNTPPPYNLECVRRAFMQAGGTPAGAMYPTEQNLATYYNTLPNWKAVLDYINTLVQKSKGVEGFDNPDLVARDQYTQQANALINLRGIRPEQLINRAPLNQGCEVFWFDARTNVIKNVTFEPYFPFLGPWATGFIPQAGTAQFAQFVAITDIRTKKDFEMKLQVMTDDGLRMSMNRSVMGDIVADRNGYWGLDYLQGPTTHRNKTCWSLTAARPNIMKVYWHDKGGGAHTFILTGAGCNEPTYKQIEGLTLTREMRGPFLMMENTSEGGFGDRRLSEIFNYGSFGNKSGNIRVFNDADSRMKSPGNAGYLRLLSGSSFLQMNNIASATWNTCTLVFRFNSMPVRNRFIHFEAGGGATYFDLFLTGTSGSSARVDYYSKSNPVLTQSGCNLQLGQWYFCNIIQNTAAALTTWSISFGLLKDVVQNGESGIPFSNKIVINNKTAINNQLPGMIYFGGGLPQDAASFNWDIAWWHLFQNAISSDEMKRDANNNWMITLAQG